MTYQYKWVYELIWVGVAAALGALMQVIPSEMPADIKAWAGIALAACGRAALAAIIAGISKRGEITAT